VEESLAGRLLVASPILFDPNFARTVVLMCSHTDQGALGVVLNRPQWDMQVAEVLPEWRDHAVAPKVLFQGGPVEPNAALALGRVRAEPGAGWTRVSGKVGLVNLVEPGPALMELDAVRLFGGYSGWSGGQLDGEIQEGSWFVVDSVPGDAFAEDTSDLWRRVLRRQAGKLAMFAYFPEDPRAN
jgi:putative transcriptional regulator